MRLHEADPSKLLGDKGYDSDDIRRDLIDRGIEPVIPPRSNRKTPIEYARSLQTTQPHRALRQSPQAVPSHRYALRENRQSVRLHVMHCSRKALD
jgi:Transposase DDE domain